MWKILKTAILVVTNIHTINKCIPWPPAHLKITGPGDGTNDVGGWYEVLAQTRAAFACGQGEDSGLEIAAIPGLPTPMFFGTVQKYTRQRCGSEISVLCFLSPPLMLLFEMKGNSLKCLKVEDAVEEQEHLGWCMVARKGRAWNEFDFLLFADFKLISQTMALEVKPQPCSATAPYKDRMVHGLTSGLSLLRQCLGK